MSEGLLIELHTESDIVQFQKDTPDGHVCKDFYNKTVGLIGTLATIARNLEGKELYDFIEAYRWAYANFQRMSALYTPKTWALPEAYVGKSVYAEDYYKK